MGEIRQALLVIDVQRGLFEKPIPIYRADELLDHVTSLASNAHRAGVTVIYVQHASKVGLVEGSTAWQLHPRLKPLKRDVAIQKTHPSAFEGTELGEVLLARGVKRLILTGLVTHGCVRATCLDALHRGYEVVLVEDAHSNYHRQAASMVREWNARLAKAGARNVKTAAVRF
jgi:nicotinamidase-related amidase